MLPPADPESADREERDGDLDDLPGDERDALAVAVGEVARDGAKDRPGGVEQDRHEGDGTRLGHRPGVDREEHRRGVDRLVVEGGEELGDEEAEEGPRM